MHRHNLNIICCHAELDSASHKTPTTITNRHCEERSSLIKENPHITSVRVFYSKHENKMYREPIDNTHKENQTQIPTQSEPAVSSIYKQNPLKMAEALEAI